MHQYENFISFNYALCEEPSIDTGIGGILLPLTEIKDKDRD